MKCTLFNICKYKPKEKSGITCTDGPQEYCGKYREYRKELKVNVC